MRKLKSFLFGLLLLAIIVISVFAWVALPWSAPSSSSSFPLYSCGLGRNIGKPFSENVAK